MTTDLPDATLPGARRLRRRTSDRVIAGVAGGLGDYLNLDPVLLRAGFAGLMIFGGAGLVLYVLAWLLIPASGQDDSIAEATIRRVARRTGRLGAAALVLVAVVIVSPWMTGYGGAFYIPHEMFWALAAALIGIVLLIPRERLASGGRGSIGTVPAVASDQMTATGQMTTAATAATTATWPLAVAPPRERSPLGWYVLAAVLVAVGVLAIAAAAAGLRVVPGQFFGVGLLVLGVGLVVGAWWGRARLLILAGLAVLPLAAVASFLTVPLEGGFGEHAFAPRTVGEARPEYRLVGGDLRIDLAALESGSAPVHLAASVGAGRLVVVVPDDARVELDARVEGGRLSVFGREHVGTGLADRVEQPGRVGGPTFVLALEAGLGWVRIDQVGAEGS